MSVVWHQVVFALDAKYNAQRAKNHPNFRTLYIRRRNQLLREFGTCKEHGFWKQYLRIRSLLLQIHYGPALDSVSLRRQSVSIASPEAPGYFQDWDNKSIISRDDVLTPTKSANASRAIVGNSSISENYAFAGVHHIFDQHTAAVTMIKFANNDRSRLCCISNDTTVSICNVLTQPPTLECILKGHTLPVTGCDWSASNDMIVTSSLDGRICLWETAKGICIRDVPSSGSQLLSCLFHPVNNNIVIAGSGKGHVEVLNISTGKKMPNMMGGRVLSLAFDSNGIFLWAGNDEGIIMSFVFNLKSGKLSKCKRISIGEPVSITSLNYKAWINREGRDPSLLVNLSANAVRIYRVIEKDGSLMLRKNFYIKHNSRNNFIRSSFCPIMSFRQGACIVTGSEDSCVYFFDIECDKENSKAVINKLQGHSSPVLGISFNYDESLLSTSDQEGLVIVWTRSPVQPTTEAT